MLIDFFLLKPNLISMNVHSATCSCSVELYISSGRLWRIFSQTGIFAGFSLIIIFIVGSISAAAIAGDLILFSLGGPVGDYTGAHTVIFRGIFAILLFAR